MDGSVFDRLTRLVATRAPRRRVIASALTAIGATRLLAAGGAEAQTKVAGKKKNRCRKWILSGGRDPGRDNFVDDDVKVLVNGEVVFEDDDGEWGAFGPLTISARKGDRLRIIAEDDQADCHRLEPLWLRCKRGGSPRRLSNGVPETCPGVAVGVFFDETFTI